jgi:16S rRNA (uracil1498-N3)-methyltransferase
VRRFRVDEIPADGGLLVLGDAAAHHLVHVLRLTTGAPVAVFDGRGGEADAEVVSAGDPGATLRIRGERRSAAPRWPLHLLLGLPKGPAADLAVRMATESGVTELHLVLTRRSVATGDRTDRWARIAESAARQCGRADVPRVHAVVPLATAIAALPDGLDRRVAVPGAERALPARGPAAVLVGPEGGLADDEVALARRAGFVAVGLGAWILRADTAAAVAVALTAPDA